MKQYRKIFIRLLLFSILLLLAGLIILKVTGIKYLYPDLVFLIFFFSLITFTALTIFLRGQSRGPESQTLHSLFSFSLKFLLELVLTLIWLIVLKKTAAALVIMFFLIYLSFTLFLVYIVLKALKNKSL